jgi:hypothetical protein
MLEEESVEGDWEFVHGPDCCEARREDLSDFAGGGVRRREEGGKEDGARREEEQLL